MAYPIILNRTDGGTGLDCYCQRALETMDDLAIKDTTDKEPGAMNRAEEDPMTRNVGPRLANAGKTRGSYV